MIIITIIITIIILKIIKKSNNDNNNDKNSISSIRSFDVITFNLVGRGKEDRFLNFSPIALHEQACKFSPGLKWRPARSIRPSAFIVWCVVLRKPSPVGLLCQNWIFWQFWVLLGPNYQKMMGFKFSDPSFISWGHLIWRVATFQETFQEIS